MRMNSDCMDLLTLCFLYYRLIYIWLTHMRAKTQPYRRFFLTALLNVRLSHYNVCTSKVTMQRNHLREAKGLQIRPTWKTTYPEHDVNPFSLDVYPFFLIYNTCNKPLIVDTLTPLVNSLSCNAGHIG